MNILEIVCRSLVVRHFKNQKFTLNGKAIKSEQRKAGVDR